MTSSPTRRLRHQQRAMGLPAGQKRTIHAHKLVAETARAMAHELYDQLMLDNEQFATWKARYPEMDAKELEDHFVYLSSPGLLSQARATLAGMLATPIDEALKESIHEALVLDATLGKGRKSAMN